jgi:hypothetical protein
MSEVYRGFDRQLRRPVAIKRLRPDLANNPVFRARFRREGEAAGGLSHPAIVAIYDTGEKRDGSGPAIPFIVMELIEGHSLRDVLHDEGKLPPKRSLEVTSTVLDALACSHAAGIIHRDIKPGNVMITGTGAAKVADFGIARPIDPSGTVTMTGTVVGTPQYLSPEQSRGEAVDVRSDIYSVGCMLYELLIGQPPFTGDSLVSIVVQHVSDPPVPPSAANSDLSSDLDAIILKALAKDPAARYQTASEMKADIEKVLDGQHPQATVLLDVPTVGAPAALSSSGRTARNWRVARGVAVMITILLIVAGTSAFGVYRATRSAAAGPSTIDVPAIIGLSPTDAESLLRSAHLLPRFEFARRADSTSVGTVIKQSPNGGEIAAVNSTIIVMINIGSGQDPAAYVPETRQMLAPSENVAATDIFRPDRVPQSSHGGYAERSDVSAKEPRTEHGEDRHGKEKSEEPKKKHP